MIRPRPPPRQRTCAREHNARRRRFRLPFGARRWRTIPPPRHAITADVAPRRPACRRTRRPRGSRRGLRQPRRVVPGPARAQAALRPGEGRGRSDHPHRGRASTLSARGVRGAGGEARPEDRGPQLRPRRRRDHPVVGHLGARGRGGLGHGGEALRRPGLRRRGPGRRPAPPAARGRGHDLRERPAAQHHVEHRGGAVVALYRGGRRPAYARVRRAPGPGRPPLAPPLPAAPPGGVRHPLARELRAFRPAVPPGPHRETGSTTSFRKTTSSSLPSTRSPRAT